MALLFVLTITFAQVFCVVFYREISDIRGSHSDLVLEHLSSPSSTLINFIVPSFTSFLSVLCFVFHAILMIRWKSSVPVKFLLVVCFWNFFLFLKRIDLSDMWCLVASSPRGHHKNIINSHFRLLFVVLFI